MTENKEDIKNQLIKLVNHGRFLLYSEAILKKKLDKEQKASLKKNKDYMDFLSSIKNTQSAYQSWFSKSLLVIKQILPDRLEEFKLLYKNEKRNNKDITHLTYYISDYFLGLKITDSWDQKELVDSFSAFYSKMQMQIDIVDSCLDSIDSKLTDIEAILQSELFDNEIETAKELVKKKHYRLGGALAGITLETHLKKVCQNHNLTIRKKNPTISDFNEILKKSEIVDVPSWRLIQRLADIRNLCVHAKERDPKIDEIQDLITGVEKLIAELY